MDEIIRKVKNALSEGRCIYADNIEWDIDKEDYDDDGKPPYIPICIEIPYEEIENCKTDDELTDVISEYISDESGFCHKGFSIEIC